MIDSLISYFTQFFFVLNPHIVAPFFFSFTQNYTNSERRSIAIKMHIYAISLGLVFAAFGPHVLGLIGVTVPAFKIGGGVLLLVAAWGMLYGSSSSSDGNGEPTQTPHRDISLCPLAFPMLVGPATLTKVVTVVDEAKAISAFEPILAVCAMTTVILINFGLTLFGAPVFKLLGKNGGVILEKLSGILLVAMSLQMILGGTKEFFGC